MTTRGRKRKRHGRHETEGRKKARIEADDSPRRTMEHPTLRRYYQQISTLRTYLISSLPASAKSRRRKVEAAGRSKPELMSNAPGHGGGPAPNSSDRSGQRNRGDEHSQRRLAALLDDTLICTPAGPLFEFKGSRERDFITFSQKADISMASTLGGGTTSIADVSISAQTL